MLARCLLGVVVSEIGFQGWRRWDYASQHPLQEPGSTSGLLRSGCLCGLGELSPPTPRSPLKDTLSMQEAAR